MSSRSFARRGKGNGLHLSTCCLLAFAGVSQTASAEWSQTAKLTASDAAGGDSFGFGVATNGGTAVVGAAMNDDYGDASGDAYIFERTATGWAEIQKLPRTGAAANDHFGEAVAISDDRIVVGAPQWVNGSPNGTGVVYVFVRKDDGTCPGGVPWCQQGPELKASDAAQGDNFGTAVGISGDTIVIGAHGNSDAGTSSGSAYIFEWNGMVWNEEVKLLASDATIGDWFGFAVAISGDLAVVGAWQDDHLGSNVGSAYVFDRTEIGCAAGKWCEQQKLTADDWEIHDQFGEWVSISGETAVIAARVHDHGEIQDSGGAYVFDRDSLSKTWSKTIELQSPAGFNHFGIAPSIHRDRIVVGAHKEFSNTGAAYVFLRSQGTWSQESRIESDDGSPGQTFGFRTGLFGGTTVIGALLDDEGGAGAGAAYIFGVPPSLVPSLSPPALVALGLLIAVAGRKHAARWSTRRSKSGRHRSDQTSRRLEP